MDAINYIPRVSDQSTLKYPCLYVSVLECHPYCITMMLTHECQSDKWIFNLTIQNQA